MNKELIGFLMLAALAAPSFAKEGCENLDQYQIKKTSFTSLSIVKAFEQLLKDTPIRASVENGAGLLISANDVSGNLGVVVSKLAENSKLTYSQQECELKVVAPVGKWKIKSGEKVSSAMASWCQANGWTLVWDGQEISSNLDINVEGQFDFVVSTVVDALNRSGAGLHATLYDANRVLRIWEKK